MEGVPDPNRTIKVLFAIRGLRENSSKFFCDVFSLDMKASDTVAQLKTIVEHKKDVPASIQVLRSWGGVLHDNEELGTTFGWNGIHGIYLWLCDCNACSTAGLRSSTGDQDASYSVTISGPLSLLMIVKPTLTISFVKTYLNMIFQGNTEIHCKGERLTDDSQTLEGYNIQSAATISWNFSTDRHACSITNTATMKAVPYYTCASTTCRDVKDAIEFVLGVPHYHQLFTKRNAALQPLGDKHPMRPGGNYLYTCTSSGHISILELSCTTRELSATDSGFHVQVRTVAGKCVSIDATDSTTVAMVKLRIQQEERIDCNRQLRLCLDGDALEDDRTLYEYDIGGGSILHLLIGPKSSRFRNFLLPRWCT